MNSIVAVALMIAILSLCNLTDKTKPAENNNRSQSASKANDPADREAVTVELMKIEGKITQASFDGDISTLASYIADDYSGTGADGKTQNKNQVLADAKQDKITKSWKITEGKLVSYDGDTAVLTYVQSQTLRNGKTYSARVTDTFVKRDGRWQVSAEQQTLIK